MGSAITTVSDKIFKVIESGNPTDAFRLAVCFEEARIAKIYEVISEDQQLSFDTLRFVPNAWKFLPFIEKASMNPRWARLIIKDIPHARTELVFFRAINNEAIWAIEFGKTYDLSYKWLEELICKPLSQRMLPEKKAPILDLTLASTCDDLNSETSIGDRSA